MELKTNTATRIAVGPLVDPTDGKTAELALTVTDLSVQIYQIKNDGSAVVRAQFAPTASGGNNDMVHVTDDTAGVYDLELTAAQLNFLGNGRITFYDLDGFLVHWIDIQVVSAAYFDWKYGSTIPDVNVTKIAGTSQTAKDLGALEVTNINTLAGHDPGATLVKVADLGTVQTGDAYARLGAPAGASVSADIAAVRGSSLTVQDIVDGVLDELLSAHADVGSVGAGIAAAGSSGDPWSTALPGAYAEGSAGYIVGTNLPSPGTGSSSWPYTLTDDVTGEPIVGATVNVSSDAAGTIIVASGTTDANGLVSFNLDPGTYYIWRSHSAYTFTDPDTETVT